MTITIPTLICWSIICAVLGATVAALIVFKENDRFYMKKIEDMRSEIIEAKQAADSWRHWTNVYRHLLEESEKRNTIIINEQPKGANIPKFGD